MLVKRMLLLCVVAGMAVAVAANPLPVCGWEECGDTVLWMDGPGIEPILATRVTAPDPVIEGEHSLKLVHNAPGATPRACLMYVEGLGGGLQIYFDIGVYDAAPGTGAYRIRGQYLPGDIDAGGPQTPGGAGWQWISHVWSIPAGHNDLIIWVEMLGDAGDTVWFDLMTAMPGGGATATFSAPCWYDVVPAGASTFSAVKDLFR